MDVKEFYNAFASDYTASVMRCNPRYADMVQSVLDFFPPSFTPGRILELGCGSGNLTLALHHAWSDAEIQAVDLSEELLEICRRRLPAEAVETAAADIRTLPIKTKRYDLICSSLTLHHLDASEKRDLFSKAFDELNPGGFFVFCDRFKAESDYLSDANRRLWKTGAVNAGADRDEWEKWQYHEQHHDRPDTLRDQLSWLRGAGFSVVDCVWRYATWATVHCRK